MQVKISTFSTESILCNRRDEVKEPLHLDCWPSQNSLPNSASAALLDPERHAVDKDETHNGEMGASIKKPPPAPRSGSGLAPGPKP